jgi:hypothetical protein
MDLSNDHGKNACTVIAFVRLLRVSEEQTEPLLTSKRYGGGLFSERLICVLLLFSLGV